VAAGRSGFRFEIDERSTAWAALRRTLENLQSHEGAFVKVGVVGEKAGADHAEEGEPPQGMTNGELARIHEFGVPGKIPARPFILGTFALNRARYLSLLKTRILPGIYLAKITVAQGLKVMGELISSDIRNRMVDGAGIPPPLSPSTIAAKIRRGAWNKKGKARGVAPRALVDTGRLRNSISYAVVMSPGEASGARGDDAGPTG
jgi:hypothetical protein